jgi:hypothetical protein
LSIRKMSGSFLRRTQELSSPTVTILPAGTPVHVRLLQNLNTHKSGVSLDRPPSTKPLALRTQPDPRANACLVWHSGHGQQMAITPPDSNGSRKTGAFLAFIPDHDANEVRMVEDGFFLFLTNITWQKIREALLSGHEILVPPAGAAEAGISVEWAKTAYTSPVSGETYTGERWITYKPETTSSPKQRLAVSSSRTILLTSQQDLQARSTAEDLAAFVAVPALSADAAEGLQERLEGVPPPKVGGPVRIDLILGIWSASSQQ